MADPNSKNTPIPIKNLYPRIFEFRKFESQIFEIQDGGSKFEKMLHFQWKNFVQRFSEVSEFECDVEFSVFKMAHKISKNTLPIFLNFNSPRWIYHLQFQKSNLIFNFSELKIPSPNLIKFQIFYKFHPLSWISKIWHSNSAQIQFFFFKSKYFSHFHRQVEICHLEFWKFDCTKFWNTNFYKFMYFLKLRSAMLDPSWIV